MAVRIAGPLRHLAAGAPVPVFVARGLGAGLAPVEVATGAGIDPVLSPRLATVLLAVGRFPGELGGALARVHDQLPHPRGAVWWAPPGHGEAPPAALRAAAVCHDAEAVPPALVAVHRGAVGGEGDRADVLTDAPPQPFAGRGDHGQGGEGMMGGVPYGRPMAMTADDRDGLALDRLAFAAGPFLAGLPPAVAVDLALQGEVVQLAALRRLAAEPGPATDPVLDLYARATTETVDVSRLERARARHHLRWLAETCRLAGLPALARRVAALAATADAVEPEAVDGLGRALRRSGLLARWSRVGRLRMGSRALTGAGARAAGLARDARAGHPAYHRLGFRPVPARGVDARARVEHRVAEARQAVDLARRAAAHGLEHHPGQPLEPPGGPAGTGVDLDAVAGAVVGMDWSDALVTIWSLELPTDAAAVPAGVAA